MCKVFINFIENSGDPCSFFLSKTVPKKIFAIYLANGLIPTLHKDNIDDFIKGWKCEFQLTSNDLLLFLAIQIEWLACAHWEVGWFQLMQTNVSSVNLGHWHMFRRRTLQILKCRTEDLRSLSISTTPNIFFRMIDSCKYFFTKVSHQATSKTTISTIWQGDLL